MSWNYRVMRHEINVPQSLKETKTEEEKYYFTIHEVYYNEAGQIYAWTKEPIAPLASSFEELIKIQTLMLADSVNKTVLEFNMKPEGEADETDTNEVVKKEQANDLELQNHETSDTP